MFSAGGKPACRLRVGRTIVVTKGKAKDSSKAEGFVACAQGRLKGYILYLIEDGRCEILVRRIKPSVPLAGIDGIPLKQRDGV